MEFITCIYEYFHSLSDEHTGAREELNPFSYKRFVSDDLASRNKRVLQVFDRVVFFKLINLHYSVSPIYQPLSVCNRLSTSM